MLVIENYLMIYVVGCVVGEVLCLFELEWGNLDYFRLVVIGKGVCFDSGGFDFKVV